MQKLWTRPISGKKGRTRTVNYSWSCIDEVLVQKLSIFYLINLPAAPLEVGDFTPILKIKAPSLQKLNL